MWLNRVSVNLMLAIILLITSVFLVETGQNPNLITLTVFIGSALSARSIELISKLKYVDFDILYGIFFLIGLKITILTLIAFLFSNQSPERGFAIGFLSFVGIYLLRFYNSFKNFLSYWSLSCAVRKDLKTIKRAGRGDTLRCDCRFFGNRIYLSYNHKLSFTLSYLNFKLFYTLLRFFFDFLIVFLEKLY